MITTILWDNDGVLVDTERIYYRACRDILAELDVVLEFDEFVRVNMVEGASAMDLAGKKGLSRHEIQAIRVRRDAYYTDLIGSEDIAIDGVEGVLASFHGRYKMGIVTSSKREHFEAIHDRTGFLRFFDFVLMREDYARSKPDPEPYLAAIEKAEEPTAHCIAIEDSPRGLRSAKAAGLACCIVRHNLGDHAGFTEADYVIDQVADLPELLKGM